MNKISGTLLEAANSEQVEYRIAPSLERRRLRAYILLLLLDAFLLHGAFALAGQLYEGQWWHERNMLAVQTMLPLFFTIALYNQAYSRRSLADWLYGARQALVALVISAALLNFVAFYTKSNAQFSRVSVTLGLIMAAVALVALRRLVPVVIEKFWGGSTMNRLIIEDGGPDFRLDKAISISAQQYDLDPTSHDPFMLDRLGRLLQNRTRLSSAAPANGGRHGHSCSNRPGCMARS